MKPTYQQLQNWIREVVPLVQGDDLLTVSLRVTGRRLAEIENTETLPTLEQQVDAMIDRIWPYGGVPPERDTWRVELREIVISQRLQNDKVEQPR